MEKNILVTDNGKVLVRVIISHEDGMISIPATSANTFLKEKSNSIHNLVQKFVTWKNKFFTLEGFDNYNDPRF